MLKRVQEMNKKEGEELAFHHFEDSGVHTSLEWTGQ